MNIKRRLVILTGLGILVTGFILQRQRAQGTVKGPEGLAMAAERTVTPIAADIVQLKRMPLKDVVEGLVGTVKGTTIELTFNGQEERLIAVHVQVGRRVKKGTVLFELDHTRSRARRNQARTNYERSKELEAAGGATARDVQEAKSALNLAQKDYEDTFIYASQDGYISQVNRQEGETIGRSEVVGVLVSSQDRLYVETGVIEGLLDQVVEGQDATIYIDAFGDKEIIGTVRGVSREVTTTGRTGTVLISLPRAIQSKLRPGMSARCSIAVFSARQALVIPRTAYDSEKNCVFTLDEKNVAHKTEIKLGHITRDTYQVLQGLSEGDRVIKDLVATPVDNGALIQPILSQSAEASPT